MKEISIRDFIHTDIADITTLTNELGYPTTESEMKERMSRIVVNTHYRTFVAVHEEVVVGYCGVFLYDCWEHNEQVMRVEVLVVRPTTRRLGVGKRLIDAAELWAFEKGAKIISLNSGNRDERESAHKFYPQLGFEARSTGYSKRVSIL